MTAERKDLTMDTTIMPAKPATYNDVYEALVEIARKVRDAQYYDRPLVEPYVRVTIVPRARTFPGGDEIPEDDRVRTVDALARELLGRDGERQALASGHWTHRATGTVGPVDVSLHAQVKPPPTYALAEVQAELARLRAENERLRAELDDDGPGVEVDIRVEDQVRGQVGDQVGDRVRATAAAALTPDSEVA